MTDRLLTPEQVAEQVRMTERTVYRWRMEERLPIVELGLLWRIRTEALEAFLYVHQLGRGGQTVDEGPATLPDELSDDDRAWLDAGGEDPDRALKEVEKEIPAEELADYLGALRQRMVPVRWDVARGGGPRWLAGKARAGGAPVSGPGQRLPPGHGHEGDRPVLLVGVPSQREPARFPTLIAPPR
ncbi:helix-turn-helix domain-containing protein [Carboxydochorda subterranea]|uniref:Helix-turn-helix domain-containing protein n=1 Tax=Carboxydichorda subterranea TaxID=3109565 RepID=A0ABZ1BU07_9FIRM|nr:helix-turn-helix domain-containing protein [Limnochorda sp. L945t]WRP16068.1 helix-turn-helix domain-containing protein [Limnochorda sp. L945t]